MRREGIFLDIHTLRLGMDLDGGGFLRERIMLGIGYIKVIPFVFKIFSDLVICRFLSLIRGNPFSVADLLCCTSICIEIFPVANFVSLFQI